MFRREMIKVALGGASARLFIPKIILADSSPKLIKKFENKILGVGELLFTEDHPGRWKKKIRGHIPVISHSGKELKVVTKHKSKDFDHYIVKHALYNEKFEFITEEMITPSKEVHGRTTETVFNLDKVKSKYQDRVSETFIVLSQCNKHDAWIDAYSIG